MKAVKSDVSFPQIESEILAFWKSSGIEEKGLRKNAETARDTRFVFYDGPPFATGMPHYGHILAGTLKDVVPRYWVMKGKYVERRWGWDCHGLPVEFEMEKELGLQGLPDIEKFGIANFNEACRGIVQRYTREWEEVIRRTGRWVDFRNNYRTMDTPFMESVWWVVRQLWDKGLIYKGYRVMPYSWRISTPLSNFEAGLNYKEVQDPAITVRFKAVGEDYAFLAWTTTPWTLPANLALAVKNDVSYVKIKEIATGEKLVLAEERLSAYFKEPALYEVLEKFPGTALEGKSYEPLFPHHAKLAAQGAFRVLLADHVTATDGTGVVHTAPAHGEEDFVAAQKYGIPLVDNTDASGSFTDKIPEFAGKNIKDADKDIIKALKTAGKIYRHETLVHSYAYCWRSDTPLMNKAVATWFMKLDPIKAQLLANNQKTHWVPEHLRDGRFGNWLENARDWNISRNRFWGTPIPIWECTPKCGGQTCVGSIDELEKLTGKRPADIHKHFVDELTIACPKCQAPMRRIPEVLDCWFESGSMPYGQAHYPFENREVFEKNFPADFIAEGLDQTRGWFYTLSVLSTALMGKPAFKNVMVNGLVLAEDGKKMSKRLKNYPDPMHVMQTYGSDAMRAYLMSSPASHAEELRFAEAGVKEVVRSVILPLWNAYSFFVTYALADGYTTAQLAAASTAEAPPANDLDRWLLSRLTTLIRTVESKMEVYHLYEVVPEVLRFTDDLTNWYIRLNRRRFWAEEKNADKLAAYATLYRVLGDFCKVLAPILPFVTESIYQNLAAGLTGPESVHLCDFPSANAKLVDTVLESEIGLVQSVVGMGRNLRNTSRLKTRQPLKTLLVITRNAADQRTVQKYQELLKTELNVKEVQFSTDEARWVDFVSKPNAKVLGPRLGTRMKEFFAELKNLNSAQVANLDQAGFIEVKGEKFSRAEVEVERKAKQEGLIQTEAGLTIWLDTALTDALVAEGRAREVVSRIQKLRKDTGLEVTDRIRLNLYCNAALQKELEAHLLYIQEETLAAEVSFAGERTGSSDEKVDEHLLGIELVKQA